MDAGRRLHARLSGLACVPAAQSALLRSGAAGGAAPLPPVLMPARMIASFRADKFFSPCLGTSQGAFARSEEHTSELQSLMRISYAVFCLKKKKHTSCRTITVRIYYPSNSKVCQ